MFAKSDLSALVYCGWRFDELRIPFPILSCHESEPMKARSRRILSILHTVTVSSMLESLKTQSEEQYTESIR